MPSHIGKQLYYLKEDEQFIIHIVDYNEIPAVRDSKVPFHPQ